MAAATPVIPFGGSETYAPGMGTSAASKQSSLMVGKIPWGEAEVNTICLQVNFHYYTIKKILEVGEVM